MLFNSFSFLFLFWPVVLAGFYLLGALNFRQSAIAWLGLSSLAFYAFGGIENLPLLIISIAFNFILGSRIARRVGGGKRAGALLALGVGMNVLALAYFKYFNFLLANLNLVLDAEFAAQPIDLPIGISFFTFTQIAFLVDCWRGRTKDYRPHEYLLFVSYFPHLVAGPILLHSEMIPQFRKERAFRFDLMRINIGLTIFTIGLFKKLVLADGMASYADPVFKAAQYGTAPDLISAWSAAFSYTMQLYFDFSGYSDMAVGISHTLGFRLPVNFWSPYKSASIIEFWRRWHISLSRFLSDHIYKPLGGNRRGQARRYANLLITMLIGGLWHGAGWTFILWGALHGFYLAINHAFRSLTAGTSVERLLRLPPFRQASIAFTFLLVVIAWVFFRAAHLDAALLILNGMAGAEGTWIMPAENPTWTFVHIGVVMSLVFLAPNTYQFMRRYAVYKPGNAIPVPHESSSHVDTQIAGPAARLTWRLSCRWAFTLALMMVVCIGAMMSATPSPFLYFQF